LFLNSDGCAVFEVASKTECELNTCKNEMRKLELIENADTFWTLDFSRYSHLMPEQKISEYYFLIYERDRNDIEIHLQLLNLK
jgi:hypothetical protein